MSRTVWIVGAGSGMGRATALLAGERGWRVALSGRRREALEATAAQLPEDSTFVVPLDVRDGGAVVNAAAAVTSWAGSLGAVVVAAGINSPRRAWADQDPTEIDDIVATDLAAPIRLVTAALPALRRDGGDVVLVSSYSAWAFNPVAGVAYSAAKKGLAELARTLNVEEGEHGVRACHLCPGDVDTDLLRMRPSPPDAEARAVMLRPEDVARSILFVLESPARVRIDELVISPVSSGDVAGRDP